MKRKIIQQLKLWKDNPARKPLILLGAMVAIVRTLAL